MSFNIVDIKVVSDYTDFSSTVRFHLNVPVSKDDATAIYKTLASGPWSDVEAGITKAVKASAPTTIQTLVAALLQAYSGATASAPVTPDKQPPDKQPDGGDGQ
jgi:hypothetical protein